MVKTAPELQSEARSNHDAAARALRMARGLTRASEIERLERFAAELETRASELEATGRIRRSGARRRHLRPDRTNVSGCPLMPGLEYR